MTSVELFYSRVHQVPGKLSMYKATIYRAAERGEITIHKRGNMAFLKVAEDAKTKGEERGERRVRPQRRGDAENDAGTTRGENCRGRRGYRGGGK